MKKQRYFVDPNDPVLTKIANDVTQAEVSSDELQNSLNELFDTAYGEQKNKDKPVLVGLAAPQVGIAKRIILVDTAADGLGKVANLEVFLNPEITAYSNEKEEWYEGCYSTDRVCGIVERPKRITLIATDRTGNKIKKEYEGYVARIFQHEIDHLNGKVFIDHIIDDEKLHWVEKNEFPAYRNNMAWKNWPKKCTRTQWKKIKNRSSNS